MALTFFSDSGHGWLRVPLSELRGLSIDISDCSYRDKQYAYLEEDCDAPAYIDAWEAKRGLGVVVGGEQHTDGESFIRRLPRWEGATS